MTTPDDGRNGSLQRRREAEIKEELGRVERLLGEYGLSGTGPLLLITGGMHGNEAGGVLAARRVFRRLAELRPRMTGRFVALTGNLGALQMGQRYIESDLNRMWSVAHVAGLAGQDPAADAPDERELRELHVHIKREIEAAQGAQVVFLDLHSTSAGGPPFSIMSDTLQNRAVALALPIPVILGLEETVSNTSLEFFGGQGYVAVGVEGGQHIDPATADNHEAVIWLSLVSAGLLKKDQVPEYDEHVRQLEGAALGLPSVVEILHRHGISPGDGFRMAPGYKNFHPIRRGTMLGTDLPGELRARFTGCVILPSYQHQGDDGYFEGRRVSPFWFGLSAVLRRLRLDRLIPLMPGVRRHPDRKDALLVNPRVARFRVVEVFHLFGFRRQRPEGDKLVFSRRPSGRWS